MSDDILARIVRACGVAEVRTRVSKGRERLEFGDFRYQVLRVTRRTPVDQDLFWQLPTGQRRAVRGVSVVPPKTSISLEVGAGETTLVSCVFTPGEFHRILKIGDWTEELTANCVSLRNSFLSAVLDRLAQEISSPVAVSDILLNAVFACVRAELPNLVPVEEKIRVTPGGLTKAQLNSVLAIIAQNIGSRARVTAEDLADSCGLSVRHLQRGFRVSTGQSIRAFIRQARLQRVKELLSSKERLPLTEIKSKAGFATSSHLCAEFRRLTGHSPSEWARSQDPNSKLGKA